MHQMLLHCKLIQDILDMSSFLGHCSPPSSQQNTSYQRLTIIVEMAFFWDADNPKIIALRVSKKLKHPSISNLHVVQKETIFDKTWINLHFHTSVNCTSRNFTWIVFSGRICWLWSLGLCCIFLFFWRTGVQRTKILFVLQIYTLILQGISQKIVCSGLWNSVIMVYSKEICSLHEDLCMK